MIVFAFMLITVSGYISIVFLISKGKSSSGKHLMRITLMRNIKYKFIFWRVKYIVQRYCRFHYSKIRSEMPAMLSTSCYYRFPDFLRKYLHLINIQLFHIFGFIYMFKIHDISSFLLSICPGIKAYPL